MMNAITLFNLKLLNQNSYFISDLSLETSLSLKVLVIANLFKSDLVILLSSLFSFSTFL